MGKGVQKLILATTGVLITFTSIKILLGNTDSLDRLLVILTLIVFFGDQITR